MIKILNLYAGIGGNRKLWGGNIEVTAVEINPEIAAIYQSFFPNDKVIITDAHQYLLEHYSEYNFIWSSPPCPTHSIIRFIGSKVKDTNNLKQKREVVYADMRLYQEIILLNSYFAGKWVVENVKSYYTPLIKPVELGRHFYWANFIITNKNTTPDKISNGTIPQLQIHNNFNLDSFKTTTIDKRTLLRNCVNSDIGLFIFNSAFKDKQERLIFDV